MLYLEDKAWLLLYTFFFLPHHKACRILVPQPGIEPTPPAVGAWSLNHWTAREVPSTRFFIICFSLNNRRGYFPIIVKYSPKH